MLNNVLGTGFQPWFFFPPFYWYQPSVMRSFSLCSKANIYHLEQARIPVVAPWENTEQGHLDIVLREHINRKREPPGAGVEIQIWAKTRQAETNEHVNSEKNKFPFKSIHTHAGRLQEVTIKAYAVSLSASVLVLLCGFFFKRPCVWSEWLPSSRSEPISQTLQTAVSHTATEERIEGEVQ